MWKKENRGGNPTKVPYSGLAERGNSRDKSTWLTYQTAKQLLQLGGFSGLGFYLSPREYDPAMTLCVIDIDAHHTDGSTNPFADEVMAMFAGTYTEYSPSGNGYHILCNVRLDRMPLDAYGKLSDIFYSKNSGSELEIYIGGATNRYMTYTGDQVSEGDVITDQTETVLAFLDRYMRKPVVPQQSSKGEAEGFTPEPLDDEAIKERLEIARRSKYGQEFVDLYDKGEWRGRGFPSQSEADFRLAHILYYWLGPNAEAIDKAFRASALMRPKWDEQRGGPTYGERTVEAWVHCGESFYTPPDTTDPQSVKWIKALMNGGHEITGETLLPDQTEDGRQIDARDVLQMIDEIADDQTRKDMITVLPLMCGTGKSTALRMKMRQIIEANNSDGMIVITDNLDRMRDYLRPGDDDREMQEFFATHGHLITVMTHENLSEALETEPMCPILIMSTQRFINLPKERIKGYLTWAFGERSLIVVDEQPYFLTEVTITEKKLDTIESAISAGLPRSNTAGRDRKDLLENWDVIRRYLKQGLNNIVDKFQEPGTHYTYAKPNWNDEGHFQRIFELLYKYRIDLNTSENRQYSDVFVTIRAIFQYLTKGALLTIDRKENGAGSFTLHVQIDHHDQYTGMAAKVIILDGTADLSVAYELYDDIHFVDCSMYRRDLSKLHVHLITMSTGKTTLRRNPEAKEQVFDAVDSFLQAHTDGVTPVVFSYQETESLLIQHFHHDNYSWFGRIRGTNDFRQRTHIAQIGINLFQPCSYFLYELAKNPELLRQFNPLPYEEIDRIVQERIRDKNGYAQLVRDRELLAELEQNIFRGTIRNSNPEEYHFYLFLSSYYRDDLIPCIRARYEALNAEIIEHENPIAAEANPFAHAMSRANSDKLQRIVKFHDHNLAVGQEYTTQDLATGVGLTAVQIQKVRENNEPLDNAMEREKVTGRRGVYVKRGNWYYDEDEIAEDS